MNPSPTLGIPPNVPAGGGGGGLPLAELANLDEPLAVASWARR